MGFWSMGMAALLAVAGARANGQSPVDSTAVVKARADSARLPYTAADVQFMQGMIHHHAQAIVMSAGRPRMGPARPSRR